MPLGACDRCNRIYITEADPAFPPACPRCGDLLRGAAWEEALIRLRNPSNERGERSTYHESPAVAARLRKTIANSQGLLEKAERVREQARRTREDRHGRPKG